MVQGYEFFRNTGLGDSLELLGIWNYPSNFHRSETREKIDRDMGEIERQFLSEQTTERSLILASSSNANSGEHGTDADADADVEGSTSSDSKKQENEIDENDPFLVDWNGPDDPENPRNWTNRRKIWHLFIIMMLTTSTYSGSSIHTLGQEKMQEDMHVGHVAGTLPLSIYVLGYGLGPVIFSPLSEVASIGRNNLYLMTLFCFVLFQIGCALAPNLGAMIVFRLITGILCSPSLATGGASLSDFFSKKVLTYAIAIWSIAAIVGPVIAPILGAAMYVAEGWRFIFWFLMMWSGTIFLLMYCTFTETYGPNILHRKVKRVRKETGDHRYYTIQGKLDSQISAKDYMKELFLRPFIIMFSEPGVLAFNTYIALAYGAFYLFFEAFPIVFVEIYHFTVIQLGLAYLGFVVGSGIGFAILMTFLRKIVLPSMANGTFTAEIFLKLPMIVSLLLPLGLFFFGWTARVHWILPIIAELFFVCAVYNIFQGTFAYLTTSYPRYIASVLASNGFMRAVFAFSFPLFGKAMYNNLGSDKYPVGWGSSLVGFFTIGLAATPFVLYAVGDKLRGRSKYAN